MKRHLSQDTLLKCALDTLDSTARGRVQDHLDGCGRCRNVLGEIEETIRTIGGVKLNVPVEIPPLPTGRPKAR